MVQLYNMTVTINTTIITVIRQLYKNKLNSVDKLYTDGLTNDVHDSYISH